MASQKLYRTGDDKPGDYPNLEPVLTRAINWELIIQQYDEMIKYATALKQGTAEPEGHFTQIYQKQRSASDL